MQTKYEKFKDGFTSPLMDIRLCYYYDNEKDSREIWLYPNEKGGKGVRLYVFPRDADAFFTPDEKWIAINDHAGSSESYLVLFRRVEGVKYNNVRGPDSIATKLLQEATGISEMWRTFHHRYFEFRGWATDSNSFIMVLWGYYDRDHKLDEWFCTFDLQTMKAYLTPEQREKDKGAVHFDRSKKMD